MRRCGDQIVTADDLRNYAHRYDEHGAIIDEDAELRRQCEQRRKLESQVDGLRKRVFCAVIVLAWSAFWIWMAVK